MRPPGAQTNSRHAGEQVINAVEDPAHAGRPDQVAVDAAGCVVEWRLERADTPRIGGR